jgi:hypothetical protein
MTHAELIEALGGGTFISHRLSKVSGEIIDREAVYKWHKRNFIPWKWRVFLLAMAKERHATPPADFFPDGERWGTP